MRKKVIPIVVALCLVFGMSAMAENTSAVTDESAAGAAQQMPQGERPQGGRGQMGMPPSGDMQGRTPPNMPSGEMPQGEFTPPEWFTPPQNAGEVASPERSQNNTEAAAPPANENVTTPSRQAQEDGELAGQLQGGNTQFGGWMPGDMQSFNGQMQKEQPKGFLGFVKAYSTPITSVVLLGLAFLFVIFYRRKNY